MHVDKSHWQWSSPRSKRDRIPFSIVSHHCLHLIKPRHASLSFSIQGERIRTNSCNICLSCQFLLSLMVRENFKGSWRTLLVSVGCCRIVMWHVWLSVSTALFQRIIRFIVFCSSVQSKFRSIFDRFFSVSSGCCYSCIQLASTTISTNEQEHWLFLCLIPMTNEHSHLIKSIQLCGNMMVKNCLSSQFLSEPPGSAAHTTKTDGLKLTGLQSLYPVNSRISPPKRNLGTRSIHWRMSDQRAPTNRTHGSSQWHCFEWSFFAVSDDPSGALTIFFVCGNLKPTVVSMSCVWREHVIEMLGMLVFVTSRMPLRLSLWCDTTNKRERGPWLEHFSSNKLNELIVAR